MKNIILYHSNLLRFGGVDTFVYNFTKKLRQYYNITFLYSVADKENLKRIKENVKNIEKYDANKKYICDICICASAWGEYPESVIAKSGRYIQMVHADYIKAKEVNFNYNKWHKTTEHVGVSNYICTVFKKLYPSEKITRIYNILDEVQETRPILKLISATRVSKEKGYERMLKLAQELRKANIKFRWTIFTDLNLYNQKPFGYEEIVYMKPSHDFWDYIKEADYGVQLSDTEGYSYFINECLEYGTPVLCTNFPSAYESVEDGKNGYILDMELSNLNIDKIVNNIPNNFKYKEKCKEEEWIELLNKERERSKNMYKVVANQDYIDRRPELIEEYNEGKGNVEYNHEGNANIKANDIYMINDEERAKEIEASGLAEVTEIKLEDEKKEAKEDKDAAKEELKENMKTPRRGRKKKGEKVENE